MDTLPDPTPKPNNAKPTDSKPVNYFKAPCLFKDQAADPGTLRIADYKKFMVDSINTYQGDDDSERDDPASPGELEGPSPKVMRPMMMNLRQSITIQGGKSDDQNGDNKQVSS